MKHTKSSTISIETGCGKCHLTETGDEILVKFKKTGSCQDIHSQTFTISYNLLHEKEKREFLEKLSELYCANKPCCMAEIAKHLIKKDKGE